MGRGINRKAKEARYRRAVGRQQLLCDRGFYRVGLHGDGAVVGYATLPATPAVQFMRAEDRGIEVDYRSWARSSKHEPSRH